MVFQTIDIHQLLSDTVIDVLVVQVVQVPRSFTRRGAEAFPWSQTVRRTIEIPSCSSTR